jgi:CheY-like chemotaxis protein
MISGKLLIDDDDPSFLELYGEKLGREGYLIERAPSAHVALEKLDQPGWDVVLLDQKFQGPMGPDLGRSLIPEIVMRAPRHHATPRRQNDIEEIDILIRNESSDPLWLKEGQYILVECKNWSKPVGASELTVFRDKMKNRNARCNLGLFVAPGGFTGPFKDNLLAGRHDSSFVLLLGHETLEGLITSGDRNAYLKKLHTDALVEQNGH